MALEISGFSMRYGFFELISPSVFKIGWCANDNVMAKRKTTKNNNFIFIISLVV
jgi:hypothetical protein